MQLALGNRQQQFARRRDLKDMGHMVLWSALWTLKRTGILGLALSCSSWNPVVTT